MPTILELFKGSSLDKAVKADKDTIIEQELTGIRVRSAVELNNPLIYGNQAIRIATRSTSAVELMKAGTGGEGADGGLIGQGLGAITGGKFGQAVFGGKVTSLNQARDGINSKLGIPQLTIPTYVNNTGELQKGIEPDTMITIAKIKNDAAGTELGKFLKQTGGGNPKTIGRQILGQGISLVKDKLREQLFGNPASLGSNTAQPANGGWEYSSQSTYSDRIRDVKNQEQDETKLAIDKASSDALKKQNELKQEGKQKLGSAAGDVSNKLKGTSKLGNKGATALDSAVEQNTQNPEPSPDLKYSETLGNYKVEYQEANTPIIDLSLVSPVYGVDRKDSGGKYGKTEYGFSDVRNNTGIYSPYNPTEGNNYTQVNKNNFKSLYGLDNGSDVITQSPILQRSDADLEALEKQDLIPFWIKSKRSNRTVHFRSYISGLSESITPSWQSSKFFGNPFSFYTYDGVERSAQFTLNVICLNQGDLAINWEKLEFLTQQTYPTFSGTPIFTNAPIISFRLGNIYKDKIGYIESLSYTFSDNGTWETNVDGLLLPKFIDVSITIKFIEQIGSQSTIYNIKRTTDAIKIINETNNSGGSFTTDSITTTETPAKVDEYGVESTLPNEGGVNKPQTNLETGKTEPTPQEKASGEVVTSEPVPAYVKKQIEKREEIISKGYPEYLADKMKFDEDSNPDSIFKLNENTYYYESKNNYLPSRNGYIYSSNGLMARYDLWVTQYNGGHDPLGKIKEWEQKENQPLPAPVPPIDNDRKRKRKKR